MSKTVNQIDLTNNIGLGVDFNSYVKLFLQQTSTRVTNISTRIQSKLCGSQVIFFVYLHGT